MESTVNPKRHPSTGFLVALNALLFLALLLPGANLFGLILAIPVFLVFVVFSGVWQTFWVFLDRRFRFHNLVRCFGFIIPVVALVVLPLLGIEPPRQINKQRPAISQSALHRAFVQAESKGWKIIIQDHDRDTVHEEFTEFVPHLNVYWIWGAGEILWLYNSDDGRVHCWRESPTGGNWQHIEWGYGHTIETKQISESPPEDLYPDYARQ